MSYLRRVSTLGLLFGIVGAAGACSAPAGEESSSSAEAIGVILFPAIASGVSTVATDSTIAVSYTHPIFSQTLSVRITGATGTFTLPEATLAGGRYGVTFTGLTDCTAFTYAILAGGTSAVSSGALHTRATGNLACTTSESLAPSDGFAFYGVYHTASDEQSATYGTQFPVGADWTASELAGLATAQVGYRHFSPGTDDEDLVEARRAWFMWNLDASQFRRATDAKLVAEYTQAAGTSSCLSGFDNAPMVKRPYVITTVQTDNLTSTGSPWTLGSPTTDWGIERSGVAGIAHDNTAPLSFSNGTVTGDYGKPGYATLSAGFAPASDGFASQMANPDPQYAWDNNMCLLELSGVSMQLSYPALPPDTPQNCSYSVNCETATITCDPAGDVFVVHQVLNGEDTQQTIDMTASPTTALQAKALQTGAAGYYVCTYSGGQTNCTGDLTASYDIPCPIRLPNPPPPQCIPGAPNCSK